MKISVSGASASALAIAVATPAVAQQTTSTFTKQTAQCARQAANRSVAQSTAADRTRGSLMSNGSIHSRMH